MVWSRLQRVASLPVFPFEPDLPLIRLGLRHETADGVENHLELGVVLSFQIIQPAGKIRVGGNHLPEFAESPHYLDIDLYGSGTVQDAGQHGYPELGKDHNAFGVLEIVSAGRSGGYHNL